MRRLALVLLTGCKLAEAPETLDEAIHAWWNGFDPATTSDEELAVVLEGTLDILDADALEASPERGSQSHLTLEETEALAFFDEDEAPLDPPDPSTAHPMYVNDVLKCTPEGLEAITLHAAQLELYGGQYGGDTQYERTYLTDVDAYRSGEVDLASWIGTIDQDASVLGRYVYTFRAELRRVRVPSRLGVFGDEVYVVRDWMPRPAEWTKGNGTFPQDYQLEVFVPVAEDRILHHYSVWREFCSALGCMDSDVVADFNVKKMQGWDARTSELCALGLP